MSAAAFAHGFRGFRAAWRIDRRFETLRDQSTFGPKFFRPKVLKGLRAEVLVMSKPHRLFALKVFCHFSASVLEAFRAVGLQGQSVLASKGYDPEGPKGIR